MPAEEGARRKEKRGPPPVAAHLLRRLGSHRVHDICVGCGPSDEPPCSSWPLSRPAGRPPGAAQPAHQTDLPLSDQAGRRSQSRIRAGGGSLRPSAADEWKGRRKAPRREDRGAIPSPQLLRCLPVGGDEGAVSFIFIESTAHLPRCGMDERSIGLLRTVGPLVRMLLEDSRCRGAWHLSWAPLLQRTQSLSWRTRLLNRRARLLSWRTRPLSWRTRPLSGRTPLLHARTR